MARMGREFQLVLLGAGLLTAGSFLWPDPDPIEVAENKARDPDNGSGSRRGRVGYLFLIHSRSAPSRTMVRAGAPGTSRGGFGSSGARFFSGG